MLLLSSLDIKCKFFSDNFDFLRLIAILLWIGWEWWKNKEIVVLHMQPVYPVVLLVGSWMSFLAIPFAVSCYGSKQSPPGLKGCLASMGSSAEVQNLWQCELEFELLLFLSFPLNGFLVWFQILSLKEKACQDNKAFGAEIALNVQVLFCWQYPLCHRLTMLLSFWGGSWWLQGNSWWVEVPCNF